MLGSLGLQDDMVTLLVYSDITVVLAKKFD
jgi:hypothetical protein